MSWINGRSLSGYENTANNLFAIYQYNVDCIRTSKIVNGVETKYYLENGEELVVNDGNTFIQIQPEGQTLTIE